MCGIAGAVGAGTDLRETVSAMSAAVAHRGPDDAGFWQEPGIALAHRRLSIIDLSSSGHQPMLSSCGRYVIVLNGEIYNYLELRQELESAGDVFQSRSDTEVLLCAFRRWGPDSLDRLNGMWAFAVWDRLERRLFASRDRFGKKPFYYLTVGHCLFFASEIKALLKVPGVAREANARVVADFCAERVSDHTEDTFYRGIKQLPAAHVLRWSDGALSLRRYWRIGLRRVGAHGGPEGPEIKSLIEEAVRVRLRADTPVGCLLSGGLDSSLVTCFAARVQTAATSTHAFSTVHETPVPEASGIDAVAAAYPGIVRHADRPTARAFWRDLDACLWHQDEPFADGSMVAHFRLMRVANSAGIKVLLGGQGADEIFGGYPGHLWQYLGSRFRLGQLGELARCYRAASKYGDVPLRTAAVYALPHPLEWRLRRARARRQLDWVVPECRSTTEEIHCGPPRDPDADPADAVLLDAIERRTLPAFLHYEDRNSMAFGVETRAPFLDYRLVERAFSLSAAAKFAGGVTKAMLRSAAEGIVPDEIRNRPQKQGYPAPLSEWVRAWQPERRSRCIAAVQACGLIRFDAWRRRFERFERGDDSQLPPVWRGLILALWHERFVGGRA